MNICVFASSSNGLEKSYYEAARELGRKIAENGHGVVFGAGADGLMGALARGAKQSGGRVVGVIPDVLNKPGIVYDGCDEVVQTSTMRERKAVMAERADAFVALPGGFGTLEELLEVITLKQLCVHSKPITLLNTNGIYTHLAALFEEIASQHFADHGMLGVYHVFDDTDSLMEYIEHYEHKDAYVKHAWLKEEK